MEESKESKEFKRNAKFESVGGISHWQALGIPAEMRRKILAKPKNVKRNKKRKTNRLRRWHIEFELCKKQANEYLKGFWQKFNAEETKAGRLTLLIDAANPGWSRVSTKVRSWCRRDKEMRMAILFSNLGKVECAGCENVASEKHHIVPCCYGGPTIAENLVMICIDCHNQIHPWLFSQEQ